MTECGHEKIRVEKYPTRGMWHWECGSAVCGAPVYQQFGMHRDHASAMAGADLHARLFHGTACTPHDR